MDWSATTMFGNTNSEVFKLTRRNSRNFARYDREYPDGCLWYDLGPHHLDYVGEQLELYATSRYYQYLWPEERTSPSDRPLVPATQAPGSRSSMAPADDTVHKFPMEASNSPTQVGTLDQYIVNTPLLTEKDISEITNCIQALPSDYLVHLSVFGKNRTILHQVSFSPPLPSLNTEVFVKNTNTMHIRSVDLVVEAASADRHDLPASKGLLAEALKMRSPSVRVVIRKPLVRFVLPTNGIECEIGGVREEKIKLPVVEPLEEQETSHGQPERSQPQSCLEDPKPQKTQAQRAKARKKIKKKSKTPLQDLLAHVQSCKGFCHQMYDAIHIRMRHLLWARESSAYLEAYEEIPEVDIDAVYAAKVDEPARLIRDPDSVLGIYYSSYHSRCQAACFEDLTYAQEALWMAKCEAQVSDMESESEEDSPTLEMRLESGVYHRTFRMQKQAWKMLSDWLNADHTDYKKEHKRVYLQKRAHHQEMLLFLIKQRADGLKQKERLEKVLRGWIGPLYFVPND